MERSDGVAAGRRVGALLLGAVLLAACNGNGSVSPSAPQPEVPTTSASAVSNGTTTPTSSTTTPEISTTTVAATLPPTTVDARAAAEAQVRAAVDRAIADFSQCLAALPACDVALLAATRADPMLATNSSRITEWNEAGYSVINRDQFRYVIETVELSDDLQQATVTVCISDGSKLVNPGAGPAGADLVIDGTYVSGREAWDVRLDGDGVWRAHDAPAVGPPEANDVCPAA